MKRTDCKIHPSLKENYPKLLSASYNSSWDLSIPSDKPYVRVQYCNASTKQLADKSIHKIAKVNFLKRSPYMWQ